MKLETKYYKDGDFNKSSNMHFLIRIDDHRKTKTWTEEQIKEAVELLEACKKQVERSIEQLWKK